MAVKTIAQLRARFNGNDRPTPQDFTDLIDTMQNIRDLSDQSIATAQPVTVVADQAARLAIGAATVVGQRVKQTDNGLTYVKQQEDGTDVADWVTIGDSLINISDVGGLSAELNRRLYHTVDNETMGRLGAKNFYISLIENIVDTPGSLVVDIPGPGFAFAWPAADFEIDVNLSAGYPPASGGSATVAIRNISGASIDVTVAPGIIVNGTDFPIILPAGSWMMVTLTCLARPSYLAPGADLVFMSWAQEG